MQFGVTFNNFCITEPFVTGGGQTLNANVEVGN